MFDNRLWVGRRDRGPALAVAALLVTANSAWCVLSTNELRLATDVSSSIRGAVHSSREIVSIGPLDAGILFDGVASGLPPRVGIDAALIYSNRIVFSTDVDLSLGGTNYADEDLVAYDVNSGAFSLFLDGSAIGIPSAADLDAVSMDGSITNLLFSLDIGATLPGVGAVTDDDVIRYAGGVFSKAFEGRTTLGIPEGADLDALYLGADGILYYSLDVTAAVGTAGTGNDHDLWAYDPVGMSTTLWTAIGLEARADLVVLDYPLDSDGDWLTDLEEASGIDEAATTFPGTTTPLSPSAYRSDATVADTDGDGMADGAEAACGTDPRDRTQRLRITSGMHAGVSNVIAWSSVTNRSYAVDAVLALPGAFTNQLAGPLAGAPATNVTVFGDGSGNSNVFYRVRLVP